MNGLQRLLMVAIRFAHCLGDYLGDWMVRKVSDKERLEDIKTWLNRGFDLTEEDIEWLIEQAERLQELEEEKERYQSGRNVAVKTKMKMDELEKQNKRYREAIERALDESGWGDEGNALNKIIGILNKALEVEE